MQTQKLWALVKVEFKKLFRDPMSLAVMLLMPVGLTLVFYVALRGITNDYYPVPGMTHFEYLVPGTMGYAVIYMGMMVALALCGYRDSGVLKRIGTTPTSPYVYLGSLIIANMIIAVFQALIVLLVSVILGFEFQGGILGLVMVCIFMGLLAVTAVGLGLITATIVKGSGAASGLSMIFIVPMMTFGTNLAVFDETTRSIARFTPNYYATDGLSVIFNTGVISDPVVWQNLLILAVISLVLVIAGVQLFKQTEYR